MSILRKVKYFLLGIMYTCQLQHNESVCLLPFTYFDPFILEIYFSFKAEISNSQCC